jgi:hypothetical protein
MFTLLITSNAMADTLPAHHCNSKNCSQYTNSIVNKFKKGSALDSSMKTTVYHGKCESYDSSLAMNVQKTMGLLLIDIVFGKPHFYSTSAAYVPEMEQGWNPYQYTTVDAMRKVNPTFLSEAEQELFPEEHYSYNKLRVALPDSYHHIYISQIDDNTLAVIGRKGTKNYYCQMEPNIERKGTPKEDGFPVSFGRDFCDFSYSCHPMAVDIIERYHQLNRVDLKTMAKKPIHGPCRLHSGRGSTSFAQSAFLLLKIEKAADGEWQLKRRLVQGPSENPFEKLTAQGLEEKLGTSLALPLLELPSLAISVAPGQALWLRTQEDGTILALGNWMGKKYTCELN